MKWMKTGTALLLAVMAFGCAVKGSFQARLLTKDVRDAANEAEANVVLARKLLDAGFSNAEVVGVLQKRGLNQPEAERVVALALIKEKQ